MLRFVRDVQQVKLSQLHVSQIFERLLHHVNPRELELILEPSN
jgi:hypothetical protein